MAIWGKMRRRRPVAAEPEDLGADRLGRQAPPGQPDDPLRPQTALEPGDLALRPVMGGLAGGAAAQMQRHALAANREEGEVER